MSTKKTAFKKISRAACLLAVFFLTVSEVYAEESATAETTEGKVIISIDATDDSGSMTYALDTDDPSAFGSSNEFAVLPGSSHTIYVRDSAGNISSQFFEAGMPAETLAKESGETDNVQGSIILEEKTEQEETVIHVEAAEEDQNSQEEESLQIDLELELEDYEYLTDTKPAEKGEGTVHSRIDTVPGKDASRVFYTITTKEGEVFYMVIDSTESADNVYLLDQVKLSDLEVLAEDGGSTGKTTKEVMQKEPQVQEEVTQEDTDSKKGGIPTGNILLLIAIAAGGGIFYYYKVYKNKKEEVMDLMDARDMEEFVPESAEDEDEVFFGTAEEEQEEILRALMEDEDPLVDMNPDEYADAFTPEDETDGSWMEEAEDEDTEEAADVEQLDLEEEEGEED